jgi:rhodanese-related sulfurtransferase
MMGRSASLDERAQIFKFYNPLLAPVRQRLSEQALIPSSLCLQQPRPLDCAQTSPHFDVQGCTVNFLLENYNWAWALAALVSGGMLAYPAIRRMQGGSLGPNDAVLLINREKAVLIDVSEPEEFARGHAGGAQNIPLSQIESSNELPKKKNVPVILMCPTGSRAVRALPTLKKLGFEHCHALSGGTNAWRQAGLPINKLDKQPA